MNNKIYTASDWLEVHNLLMRGMMAYGHVYYVKSAKEDLLKLVEEVAKELQRDIDTGHIKIGE